MDHDEDRTNISWPSNLIGGTNNNPLKYEINTYSRLVSRLCRDQLALERARNLVPIANLVQDNLDVLEGDYQDKMLPLIVDWFGNDFFTWFSPPQCEMCGCNLTSSACSVNIEGRQVEHYKCTNQNDSCQFTYDFIRHNDPAILLATRRGRCGEWANCFMLFLKALDYDSRIVLDTTDHVWNEVWSEARQRWIHVDPCENSVDNPMLYEVGWSKRLEYCLAFGPHEVLDVTRRYSIDFNGSTRRRRQDCDETWLENYLNNLTLKLLENLPPDLKETVKKRRELDKQFMIGLNTRPLGNLSNDKANFSRRKSGSMAWRIERGDYNPILKTSFVIEVLPRSVTNASMPTDRNPLFSLQYNSIRNSYMGSCTEGGTESPHIKGWSSMVYSSENLDYKYERDWKTSYLARYETCPCDHEGKVVWRFGLSALQGTKWSKIEIELNFKVYPNTSVSLELNFYDRNNQRQINSRKLKINQLNSLPSDSIPTNASDILELVAKLSGGDQDDEVAWQKPQLFRQTRGVDNDKWPFVFMIY